MDAATAKKRLKRMTASDSEPLLTDAECDELLLQFSARDAAGNKPGTADWQPTYRLNAAAAEGWNWKAAKASELISVDLDDERMSSNQIFEHCQRMAQTYKRKGSGTITMASG